MRISIACVVATLALTVTSAHAQAPNDNDVFGVWRDVESGGHLRVYPCADKLCIKVAKVAKAVEGDVPKDVKNPDRALRDRPLLGVVIMSDGKKSGPGTWDGHLYNTQDGDTYTGMVKIVSKSEVKLSGCVLGGLICANRVWRKVGD